MTAEQELNALRADLPALPSQSPTLANLNSLVESLGNLRDQKSELESQVSALSAQIESINQSLIDTLIANELTSYKAPTGAISVTHLFSAKLPQGPDKATCFEYLKSIGRFDEMASIHSATFNSWVKEQYDLAKERGEDEPKLPGVNDVKTLLRISFRRSK